MSLFGDVLEAAVQKAFTRPAPQSAGAQMRYLVKQLKTTKAVTQMLRIPQRTVERYVKDQIKKPRPELAARLEREVKARWQPQIRAKAREKAATTGGIAIDTRPPSTPVTLRDLVRWPCKVDGLRCCGGGAE
jgi:hypothetical protein